MTDYMKDEPIWVVHGGKVYGCLFLQDTEWFDGKLPLILTTMGIVHVTSTYKSSNDAQMSLTK